MLGVGRSSQTLHQFSANTAGASVRGARYLIVGAGTLAAAFVVGFSVGYAPAAVLLLVLLVAGALVFLLTPAWLLLPAVVAAGAATALVRLELPETAEVLGQGRTAALLAALAVFYAITRQIDFRVPRLTLIAASAYAGSVLLSAFVAMAHGSDAAATFAIVQRELSQTLGPLLLVLIVFSGERGRLRAFRALAVVTLALGLMSIAYWSWSSEAMTAYPRFAESLFENARAAGGDRGIQVERATFPFVDTDPNSSSLLFAMLGAFCAAPLLVAARLSDRLLGVLAAIAGAGAVLSTQSRMGVILLAAIGVTYVLVSHGLPRRARVAIIAAVVVTGVLVVAIFGLLFPDERRITVDDRNVQSRMAIWYEAVDDISASPIYGHGLGYGQQERYRFDGLSVHNEYLQRAVDGGIVGLLAFLGALGTFGVMGLRVARRHSADAAIGIGGLGALAALLLSMIAIASHSAVPFAQVLSWTIFGVVAVAYDWQERDASGDTPHAPSTDEIVPGESVPPLRLAEPR